MRLNNKSVTQQHALTILELIMVIAILSILMVRLLPTLAKAKPRAQQIQCLGNLKSTGNAFHLFASDHEHKFPMEVPVSDGGSADFVRTSQAYRHFQPLARTLANPKILICPTDNRQTAGSFAELSNSNLSYFVGVEAKPRLPNSLLAGDRNISDNGILQSNVLTTNFAFNVSWTTNLHNERGNILFADGHVSQVNSEGLRTAFKAASPNK